MTMYMSVGGMECKVSFTLKSLKFMRVAVLCWPWCGGSLGMGLSFEMDGARVGILQWNYVKLGSLSSSCLTEFACFCLRR